MTHALATVNWTAVGVIAGIITGPGLGIARWLGHKLDAVGEHLERQDARGARMDRRLLRLEVKAGLDPLPRDD